MMEYEINADEFDHNNVSSGCSRYSLVEAQENVIKNKYDRNDDQDHDYDIDTTHDNYVYFDVIDDDEELPNCEDMDGDMECENTSYNQHIEFYDDYDDDVDESDAVNMMDDYDKVNNFDRQFTDDDAVDDDGKLIKQLYNFGDIVAMSNHHLNDEDDYNDKCNGNGDMEDREDEESDDNDDRYEIKGDEYYDEDYDCSPAINPSNSNEFFSSIELSPDVHDASTTFDNLPMDIANTIMTDDEDDVIELEIEPDHLLLEYHHTDGDASETLNILLPDMQSTSALDCSSFANDLDDFNLCLNNIHSDGDHENVTINSVAIDNDLICTDVDITSKKSDRNYAIDSSNNKNVQIPLIQDVQFKMSNTIPFGSDFKANLQDAHIEGNKNMCETPIQFNEDSSPTRAKNKQIQFVKDVYVDDDDEKNTQTIQNLIIRIR